MGTCKVSGAGNKNGFAPAAAAAAAAAVAPTPDGAADGGAVDGLSLPVVPEAGDAFAKYLFNQHVSQKITPPKK